jgi:clan AA aspartic protease
MKERIMGSFKEEITISNNRDEGNARQGLIPQTEVRSVTVKALPDTGVMRLVINEELRQALGLDIVGTRRASYADGRSGEYSLTEPVSIHWKNRNAVCRAAVMAEAKQVLLGAIPLEDMDLMVDPVNLRLTGVHGDVEEEYCY